ANLVGIAMVRELVPLITAIVVTGRSGSGFTAELGTMKVAEEIDALRTLGFSPFGYLVVPRCLVLILCLPVLTLIGDGAAIMGSLSVVVLTIDTTPLAYLALTHEAVDAADVIVGLVKSLFYALSIGLVACYQGLRAEGGAEGVGRRTTTTVVQVLVLIVALDAGLTIIAHQVGL
ncbi:MAG: ABC transporter permease, partial [Myxococcota bacterium]